MEPQREKRCATDVVDRGDTSARRRRTAMETAEITEGETDDLDDQVKVGTGERKSMFQPNPTPEGAISWTRQRRKQIRIVEQGQRVRRVRSGSC